MSIWVIHVLLCPLYQLVSTIRHELAHVIAAKLSGARVTEIRFLPHRRYGKWYWGYVGLEGTVNAHSHLAPYYVNIVCLCVGIWMLINPPKIPIHWKVVSFIMLILSPVVDTMYNLTKWWLKDMGDFAEAWKCK